MTKTQRLFLISVGLVLLFVSGTLHLLAGGALVLGLLLVLGAILTAFGIVG